MQSSLYEKVVSAGGVRHGPVLYPAFFLLLGLFCLLPATGCTKRQPEPLARDGWITDYAEILPPAEEARLSTALAEFEKETCHQVMVLIVPSLEAEKILVVAERAALAWDIGQKGFGNGILLTIALQDKTMRIDTGSAFDWFIEQGVSERVLNEVIAPRFSQKRYAEGIEAGLAEIMEAARLKVIPADHRPDVCRN